MNVAAFEQSQALMNVHSKIAPIIAAYGKIMPVLKMLSIVTGGDYKQDRQHIDKTTSNTLPASKQARTTTKENEYSYNEIALALCYGNIYDSRKTDQLLIYLGITAKTGKDNIQRKANEYRKHRKGKWQLRTRELKAILTLSRKAIELMRCNGIKGIKVAQDNCRYIENMLFY